LTIPWTLARSFFVEAARISREDRYKVLFEMAWDGKGLTLELSQVPDDILRMMIHWRNEKVEAENEETRKLKHTR
jgi:hypothetical protein